MNEDGAMKNAFPLALICAAALPACDLISDLAEGELVAIEATEVSADPEAEPPLLSFTVTIANRGTRPLYLGTCAGQGGVGLLEKSIDGEWQVAYHPACPLIVSKPFRLDPGRVVERHWQLSWTQAFHPSLDVTELPGTYRAVFAIGRSATPERPTDLLPVEFSSVVFEVPRP